MIPLLPPPPLLILIPIPTINSPNPIPIRLQIHLPQPHNLRPLEHFPAQIHNQHNRQFDIEADERDRAEGRTEAAPALY